MVLKESLVLIRYYCVPQGQVHITHENAFAPTVQLSALAVEQRQSQTPRTSNRSITYVCCEDMNIYGRFGSGI